MICLRPKGVRRERKFHTIKSSAQFGRSSTITPSALPLKADSQAIGK